MQKVLAGLIVLGWSACLPASADPLSGKKQVFLIGNGAGRTLVGNIIFSPEGTYSAYKIDLTVGPFTEHFLSMRPFRCLEGPDKHWCHVPYPYAVQRKVSAGDLTDLEYDLLFIHKGATEYGIDMWNGVYYQLRIDGDRLVGELHEMDMGLLAVPPAEGELRPVTDKDIHQAEPDSHWLPRLVIE